MSDNKQTADVIEAQNYINWQYVRFLDFLMTMCDKDDETELRDLGTKKIEAINEAKKKEFDLRINAANMKRPDFEAKKRELELKELETKLEIKKIELEMRRLDPDVIKYEIESRSKEAKISELRMQNK
jgi:hypothetical protein